MLFYRSFAVTAHFTATDGASRHHGPGAIGNTVTRIAHAIALD
jgi:hypothetical protein